MGEYTRINEGFAYWQKYGKEMQVVDASLVTPALTAREASVACKWLADSNTCRCRVQGKDLELVCDVRDEASGVVDVTVFRLQGVAARTKVGAVSVQLPCANWAPLQAQLQALL